jgi:hypothetical protein
MLGFILSKMNFMIFAFAVAIIALLMLSFTGGIELKNVTEANLNAQVQTIQEQLNSSSTSAFDSISIPNTINYGLNKSNRLFYELGFSRVEVGDSRALILSIFEHGSEEVIDSKRIVTNAEVILIDPGFIATDDPIGNYYGVDFMSLYPRAALSGDQATPPNAFSVLKSTRGGQEYLYIVPCSTLKSESYNNCQYNVIRLGCFELSKEGPSLNDNIYIDFAITLENPSTGEQVTGWTWEDCQNEFGFT